VSVVHRRRGDAGGTSDLARLTAKDLSLAELAGGQGDRRPHQRPADGQPIGGIKVATERGWFAARPSGTEAVYKLSGETFRGPEHLRRIQERRRP
jgi:phosphoglucomutase